MLKGIDVSEFQGTINWSAVKKNIDFVIARSSFGTARADTQFSHNAAGLRTNNIPHGFYHYAYPNNNTAKEEATFCWKTVSPLQAQEIIALDFEEQYPGNPVTWCLEWLQEFERLSGYKPMLYINLAMIQAHDWTPIIHNNTGLWLAEWDSNPNGTIPPVPWPVVAMRQYSDKIDVAGIGTLDGDVFYGDTTVFAAYGYQPAIVVPPVTPPTTATLFPLPSGQRVDLTNAESMKVCATVWDAVVNLHHYLPMADLNAIGAKLGLPADSNKDAIIAAIVQLQRDKTTAENNNQQLQKQIPQLETNLKQEEGQVSILSQHLDDEKKLAQDEQGHSYKELYNTLTTDYTAKKTIWEGQFKTDVAVFSQLKRNNIYYLPTTTIFSYWFQRITGQVKQTMPPPLTPDDFKYGESVRLPLISESSQPIGGGEQ